jgi:drug/metabolite transporter (DMT)-like permease
MTVQTDLGARPRIAPAGLVLLAVTSIGWGLNWPIMKQILTEWPPLSARGLTGIAGGLLLALLAVIRGESLRVPQGQWPRLLLSAVLNVSTWMTLMGLALLWLPASEAAVIAYTMPVWASLLAWLILGERMSLTRMLALVMAFAGIAALMGGNGIEASTAKLPGIAMVLVGAFVFALGTIAAKRLLVRARHDRGQAAADHDAADCVLRAANRHRLCPGGVGRVAVRTSAHRGVIDAGLGLDGLYDGDPVLHRLCLLVRSPRTPALHEPLGIGQIAALVFTLAGVALAARS